MLGDYRFKDVAPRMTESQFWGELRLKRSPVPEQDARRVYRHAVARRVSPEALLGMFWKESRYGTDPDAICVNANDGLGPTLSWGNTSMPHYGAAPVRDADGDVILIRGRFPRSASWYEGGITTVNRLWDHAPYVGKLTVREIVPTWAPSSENNTEGYILTMLAMIENFVNLAPPDPSLPRLGPWIALSSGHHNEDGGNITEHRIVGRMVQHVAAECARLGLRPWVAQPDGPDPDSLPGDGDFPGGIWDVADEVVRQHASKRFGAFLELHTQGLGNANTRGLFGIHPLAPGDAGEMERTKLIPAIVGRLSLATGIPIWSDGIMAETETGVGREGHRLGIFNRTAPIRASCPRVVLEMGTHTNASDLRIMQTEGYYLNGSRAIAEGIAAFLGWEGSASSSEIYDWWRRTWTA